MTGYASRNVAMSLRAALFFIVVCFVHGNRLPSDRAKKVKAQSIIRQNVASSNRNDELDKKIIQSNLTRRDKIQAMGPSGLTMIKRNTEKKVRQFQGKINTSQELSDAEKEFKFHLLELFIEELSESEKDMLDAQQALKESLFTDFRDPAVLMENSKKRLEALRIATLKEEQSFNRIKNIEDAMNLYKEHSNESKSLMDGFLKEVADAADQLESEIEQKILPAENAVFDGAHIEAVLHMKEGEEHLPANSSQAASFGEYDERLDVLVDSQNNIFILTRPKDTTSPSVDHYLILDIIFIYLASFPFAYLCTLIGLPSIFGYVMAGLALGPSGLNWIQALVQVESFGEFGVFMIMFFAGLEFSFEKVKKVWVVAVKAPLLISIIMTFCGLIIGSLLNYDIPKRESAFIALCMSMSSTPLVLRFVQDSSSHQDVDYSSILLAMLVMQDILLGIVVAILPAFSPASLPGFSNRSVATAVMFLRTVGSLAVIIFFVIVIAKYCAPSYLHFVTKQSKEVQLLGSITFMFILLLFTNSLGISMELGCFIAGFLISISNFHSVFEKLISPIHDLFIILFFATVGFHIFPKFVADELTYLIWLTAVVIGGKYVISLFVLHVSLPPKQREMKWLISGGLAQVSEFSFILGSRARHLKIVSREVFLLILSITTLSLIFAPVMWKISLWKFRKTLHIG